MMKTILLALCGLLPCVATSARALEAGVGAPAQPRPEVPVQYSPPEDAQGQYTRGQYAPRESSIIAHLQLRSGQTERLSRLYDDYASKRLEHEDQIARWQSELRRAQYSSDERQETKLARSINDTRRQVEDDLLGTRFKALKTLTLVQRAQLKSVARDPRVRLRHDRYFQLLLMPAQGLWQAPLQRDYVPASSQNRTRSRRSQYKGGNYGVYGGYGYGQPQYGVYGNYGKGPIGVHAGIGRGGPSIGIGIGGVFGGRY